MSTYTRQEFEAWVDRQTNFNGNVKMDLSARVEDIEYLVALYGNMGNLQEYLKSKKVRIAASCLQQYNNKHSKKLRRK